MSPTTRRSFISSARRRREWAASASRLCQHDDFDDSRDAAEVQKKGFQFGDHPPAERTNTTTSAGAGPMVEAAERRSGLANHRP